MTNQYLNLSTDNTLGGNNPSKYKAVSEKSIQEYIKNNYYSKAEIDAILAPIREAKIVTVQ